MENSAKQKLEAYAMEHFGGEMDALGYKTYKGYRWYKLIRDEALLSFGFIPDGLHDSFSMQIGLQPMWAIGVPPGAEHYRVDEPPFLLNVEGIRQDKYYPRLNYYVALTFTDFYPDVEEAVQEMLGSIVYPILSRLTDIRTVCEEAVWLDFIWNRYAHRQEMPPTPLNYQGFLNPFSLNSMDRLLAFLFFRRYDDCSNAISFPSYKFRPDYSNALEQRDFEWLEARLHENYAANLKAIKRRLKLEPDCKDTLWDRELRDPIDFDAMLWKRFQESTEGNEEGDYTIYSI